MSLDVAGGQWRRRGGAAGTVAMWHRDGQDRRVVTLRRLRAYLTGYAWQLIGDLTRQLRATGADHAGNQVPPPDEAARGQLLRMMASDAMRATAERHFG